MSPGRMARRLNRLAAEVAVDRSPAALVARAPMLASAGAISLAVAAGAALHGLANRLRPARDRAQGAPEDGWGAGSIANRRHPTRATASS